eukprot:15146687-Alexandrium_andersonii.AAC.1
MTHWLVFHCWHLVPVSLSRRAGPALGHWAHTANSFQVCVSAWTALLGASSHSPVRAPGGARGLGT